MKLVFTLIFLLSALSSGADINSALPVSIWDKTGANSINVTSNALNSFITNSTLAVTQSGTWTTGRTWTLLNTNDSVNVGNFPATFGVTQSTSPWVISGTVIANQGTSPWVSNISQFGGTNVVTGTGNSGAGIPRVTVSNDSSISNISGTISLPTGASTSSNQTNGTQKTQVVDGSGNVQPSGDILTRKIFVQPTDGTNNQGYTASNEARVLVTPLTNSSVVKAQLQDNAGTAITLGQKTMSSSIPAVLSSDQTGINTFQDKSGTGTITALNGAVTASTNGASTVFFNITGTWVATLLFEGQDGNGNWIGILGSVAGNGSPTASTGTNLSISVPCGGFNQVRVRSSAFTSGTANINYNVGSGLTSIQVYNLTPSGLQTTDRLNDGSGNPITSTAVSSQRALDINMAQPAQDRNGTGTVTALNGAVTVNTQGASSVQFVVSGTWVATLTIEGTVDGTNWNIIQGDSDANDSIGSTFTVNGLISATCGGFSQVRLRASLFTSGTANIAWDSAVGLSLVEVYNTNPASLKMAISDGSGSNAITSTTISGTAANKQGLDINILTMPATRYYTAFSLQQTAGTAANGTVFAMRNAAASTKTAIIENISCRMGFNATNPITRTQQNYIFQRFSVATPTGGTALTAGIGNSSDGASQVTDIRFLDTGLTTTGVTFVANNLGMMACDTTQGITCSSPVLNNPSAWSLIPGEGLAVRLGVVAVTGQTVSCNLAWREQ